MKSLAKHTQLPLFMPLLTVEQPMVNVEPTNIIVFPTVSPTAAPAKPSAKEIVRAVKLESLADGLQPAIDHKFSERQENTGRRARIAEGQRADGRRLQQIQSVLRGIAAGLRDGTLATVLRGISTKKQVEFLRDRCNWTREDIDRMWTSEHWANERAMLKTAGIDSVEKVHVAIESVRTLRGEESEAQKTERKIRELEHKLIGCDIPGFFPTPPAVVRIIMDHVGQRRATSKVLEPSAGNGVIADALLRDGFLDVSVLEINYTLREILKLKGLNVVGDDCLEHGDTYDLIVMNPPFEKGQDCQHVRYLFDNCLRPAGRLISVMSPAFEFRKERLYAEFRDWLAAVDAQVVQLPDGAFKESKLRTTGVSTRLIVLDKAN